MRYLSLLVFVGSCASAKDDTPVRPVHEVVVGSARVRGGGMRMDVQLGRPQLDHAVKAGTTVAAPNGVVTP